MKTMIEKLRSAFRKPEQRIQITAVKSTKITLEQWRKDPSLVEQAKNLQASSAFRMMMDCLRSEHPCGIAFPAVGAQPTDRMALQSKIEGYELALNRIEAMATPYKISKPLEATFESPQQPKK